MHDDEQTAHSNSVVGGPRTTLFLRRAALCECRALPTAVQRVKVTLLSAVSPAGSVGLGHRTSLPGAHRQRPRACHKGPSWQSKPPMSVAQVTFRANSPLAQQSTPLTPVSVRSRVWQWLSFHSTSAGRPRHRGLMPDGLSHQPSAAMRPMRSRPDWPCEKSTKVRGWQLTQLPVVAQVPAGRPDIHSPLSRKTSSGQCRYPPRP